MERLNASLNQVGLGFSPENLGSSAQIFGNIVGKRLLPVLAVVEGYKYTNYEFENAFGIEYEDAFADMFRRTQIGTGKVADALGITGSVERAETAYARKRIHRRASCSPDVNDRRLICHETRRTASPR